MAQLGPIVDAHHHIWRLSDLAWLSGPTVPRIFGPYDAVRRDYSVEEFKADVEPFGVTKSVYVQANWPVERSLDEAKWVQETANRTGWPHAIVAFADLADPGLDSALAEVARLPLVRGIRQQLHWHENAQYRFAKAPAVMADPDWRRGFAKLAEYGLLFELQVFAGQMADGADLARAFPETVLVLEHAGMLEDTNTGGWSAWRDGMRHLANEPNVHVKLSGLGTFVHQVDRELTAQIIGETVELFGAERCLYGSNFPIEKIWTDYGSLIGAYKAAVAHLSEADQRAIFSGNAERLYLL